MGMNSGNGGRSSKVVPKYFRISQDIIALIKDGTLQPGMQIPSENEIIRNYEVSNVTARKVLQEIEWAGWATRIKGKGTFVRQRGIERTVTRILGFTQNMREAGRTPRTKLLHAGTVDGGYSAEINGRKYSMPGPVYKIHRLRFADDVPMMIETRYISLELCKGIETEDFEQSLYNMYENRYNLQLKEVRQMLSSITIDTGVKEFFDLREGIPGLRVEGVTFCGKELIL